MLSVKNKKKLIIGCAQFGSKYGITNTSKPNLKEQRKILNLAKKNKISFIDTSPAYGNSEENLGKIGVNNFNIISKINKLSKAQLKNKHLQKDILDNIKTSLKKLKIKKFYGLLLHNSLDLNCKRGFDIYSAMIEAKKQKLTKKIGVSIYDISLIEKILLKYNIDIIQVPFNIMDRRLLNKKILKHIKKKKIEIHIRSIFLQGLLLMKNVNIDNYFRKWKKLFLSWEKYLKVKKIDAKSVCINYALSIKEFDNVVIGVNNFDQLKEILNTKKININPPKKIMSNSKLLINPYLWKIK